MTELVLPLLSRSRGAVVVDFLVGITAVVGVVILVLDAANKVDATVRMGGVATVWAIFSHRLTGHNRVTWFEDHVELRNPFLTVTIPRGEIVEMANLQVERGPAPYVVVRDGENTKYISCAAPLPDHVRRLSRLYTALPGAPRGPVRMKPRLYWYDVLWLVAYAMVFAGAKIIA